MIEAKLDRGPRRGRDRADPARHAQGRRHHRVRRPVGPGARSGRRSRPERRAGRARRCRSRPWAWTACPTPAIRWSWSTTSAARARSPSTASASGASRRRRPRRRGSVEEMFSQLAERRGQGAAGRDQVRRPRLDGGDRRRAAEARHRGGRRCACCTRGVGAITESDVTLALASKALSASASTSGPTPRRASWRRRDGVEIRYHSIIYELLDEVKAALSGMLCADLARDHARPRRDPRGVHRSPRSARSPAAG